MGPYTNVSGGGGGGGGGCSMDEKALKRNKLRDPVWHWHHDLVSATVMVLQNKV